jgi:hypothetical protein
MHPLTQPNGYGNGNQGNYANMSALAPPPFQASYQNFDGSVTSQPMTNERDAFINRINQAMTPYAMNSGTQRTTMGPPQFDIQSLWGQAQNDAANGWTNPLAGLFG